MRIEAIITLVLCRTPRERFRWQSPPPSHYVINRLSIYYTLAVSASRSIALQGMALQLQGPAEQHALVGPSEPKSANLDSNQARVLDNCKSHLQEVANRHQRRRIRPATG